MQPCIQHTLVCIAYSEYATVRTAFHHHHICSAQTQQMHKPPLNIHTNACCYSILKQTHIRDHNKPVHIFIHACKCLNVRIPMCCPCFGLAAAAIHSIIRIRYCHFPIFFFFRFYFFPETIIYARYAAKNN